MRISAKIDARAMSVLVQDFDGYISSSVSDALNDIADGLKTQIKDNYYRGDMVRPLKPETIEKKRKSGSPTPSTPLVFSGAMADSVSVISKSSKDSLRAVVGMVGNNMGIRNGELGLLHEDGFVANGKYVPPRPLWGNTLASDKFDSSVRARLSKV